MLAWRLGISAILIPLLFLLFRVDLRAGEEALILWAFCLLVLIRSTFELKTLLTRRNMQPTWLVPTLLAGLTVTSGWMPHWFNFAAPWNESLVWISMASSLSILLFFLNRAILFREPGQQMETLGAELLMFTYLGVLIAVTTQLRWVAGASMGYLAIGSLIFAAKGGDIGAYFLGRYFGKAKLIPRLSPGKTRVGGYGALLGGGLASVLWFHFATGQFMPGQDPPALWATLLYGVIIAIVGLVGDLAESLIKRDCEQKDSAALMPAFGGLLDLIDSVIYAGPVALLLWYILPLQTW
ncbi:Phosphatidate cytidylyltransferase [Polystyrenella longa]|uniref:Phosphatidate cytidylyltransferase n=1 Tax=Polystyrenella longa TaxID=2528007 RepID=A0A518CS79_9PLAN|nr:phosphatidate cytidylyltransferase [Polystyrenella longa]QDU82054.1 Phosphatidate cytidylyltransferase [Polystyrenella longa]